MSDLVGRFARDMDFDRGQVLITQHFSEINIAHYIYVDQPGGGSQNVDHMKIEPHPAEEANRLRQEIEDLRDEHWAKHKEYSGFTERFIALGYSFVHKETSILARRHRDFAVRLTQILEGVQV